MLSNLKFIPVNIPKLYNNEKKNVVQCLKTNWISSEGKFVKEFEKKFSKYNLRKYGVAVSSGTAALEVAIKSLNLKKDSEVLIPAFSIISTALCVIKCGLKPILIDCNISTWNTDADEVIKKITKKTSAIIITHIYGLPVNLSKILITAKKKRIKIIEDAAEVIGLKYKNKICGSFGDISTFSFYANKHITTGEGGMIVTNEKNLFLKCKSLRNLSFSSSYFDRYNHDDIGWNYRMTNLQAALGCGQIDNIKKIIKRKREIGNIYYNNLKNNKNIILQQNINEYSNNIYWVFGILLKKKNKINRNFLMKKLLKHKIDTRPFFLSMNKQKIFRKMKLFSNDKMPNAEYLSKNGFYVPSGLGISNHEVKYICKILNQFLN
ncbi:DegT/DnrJ/EryC1/StrS aminotransferase family protein [Pelagibacteraceae bacterium]|nr:DegT/DnrJ/EryC1/StrS aminotransferase family protein [Pelagibacteraceae bacterium]